MSMYTPVIHQRVRVTNTTHADLDQQKATVIGIYGSSSSIILFDTPPEGYNPAIVIVNVCLEKDTA